MSYLTKSRAFSDLHWLVEDAEYLENFKVKLWFRDGSVKIVDLEHELWGKAFEPLKDKDFFSKVRYDQQASTITWPNGANFAPEFLYEKG